MDAGSAKERADRGRMLVVSGPSGAGKSTICRRLLQDERVVFSTSATTRQRRTGEVHGRDYWFLRPDEFRRKVDAGEFIEWAEVHGNLYGTLRESMEEAIARGDVYLLEIDVQGALQLKELGVAAAYVFIAPPDFDVLRKRLVGRATDEPEVIERRLTKAQDEYNQRDRYDHIIVNDDLDAAVRAVREIAGLGPTVTPRQ